MKTWPHLACVMSLGLMSLTAQGSVARAAEIRVFASNAVAEIMSDLVPAFERTTGHKVVATYEPTNGIMARLKQGESADLIIMIKQSIGELKKSGRIVSGTDIDIARTRMGLAVRAGAPKPDISTPAAFRQSMLGAKSVARAEIGASGIHLMRVFERLGIAEEMKPKMKTVQGATRAADLVARGEAELAFQMMSELLPVAGVDVVGPLPGDLEFEVVIAGGVSSGAKEQAAAAALLKFISAPDAAPILAKRGLDRV